MKRTIIGCDVCGSEKDKITNEDIQIIFTTDQTEGRYRDPYLSINNIDICEECKSKILEGNMLFAEGAQGYNTYWFKDKIKKVKSEK